MSVILFLFSLLMLASFCAGLAASMTVLYWVWRIGPKQSKDDIFCFLSIALGVYLWVVLISVLFDPMLGSSNNTLYLYLYSALIGATPLAACPGLFLFGPRKR